MDARAAPALIIVAFTLIFAGNAARGNQVVVFGLSTDWFSGFLIGCALGLLILAIIVAKRGRRPRA